MKIVTVDEMREIEQATDTAGISYAQMMEHAGQAVARAIRDRMDAIDKRVVILVGPGNNGGDGLVAGRALAEAGAQVSFYLLKPRDEEDGNFRRVREMGLFVVDAPNDQRWRVLHQLIAHADVIVDALLGTGGSRPVEGDLAKLLDQVKRGLKERSEVRKFGEGEHIRLAALTQPDAPAYPVLIVAVDGPTGLNYDSGELDPAALPADLTVTFAAPKVGQFRFPGAGAVGQLLVADIGVPEDLDALRAVKLELATAEMVRGWLPARPLDANKATFGRALIVAGSANYTGAAALAGMGAYRVGAGLVTLAIPGMIHASLSALLPEATFLLLPQDMGVLSGGGLKPLAERIGEYQAMLVGPGLGREKPTAAFLESILGNPQQPSKKAAIGFRVAAVEAPSDAPALQLPPLVVDADALNLLAEMEDWPKRLPAGSILTPHPGEMARLMKVDKEEIQGDRVGAAQRMAAEWGHVVVLKGAHTVVAAPDGRTMVQPFANPGLATAGTGDVLAGAIVGLRAQAVAAFEAAVCGAYLHGLAGELARQARGAPGMIARDVAAYLPDATTWMKDGRRMTKDE
jgi:NAD(P)H-hydrate epimerase